MFINSVNLATKENIKIGSKTELTGIYKRPVATAIVGPLGLDGDAIVSEKHHGGPDQAVYVYTLPDYELWQKAGVNVEPGIFGENLTLSHLRSAELAVGDRLLFKEVELEVTSPRIPCATLASRMGDDHFVAKFVAMEAPGFYCRVLRGGQVSVLEEFSYLPYGGERVKVLELFANYYEKAPTRENLQRYLASPLAIRTRKENEKRLAKMA